jgi:hypothetical protein
MGEHRGSGLGEWRIGWVSIGLVSEGLDVLYAGGQAGMSRAFDSFDLGGTCLQKGYVRVFFELGDTNRQLE